MKTTCNRDFFAEDDRPRETCGIFGVYAHPEASNLTYLGLHSLQHRGQESAGIVSSDKRGLHSHRGMGLVADVFDRKELLANLPGNSAIGHVRYGTFGETHLKNAQPFTVECREGPIAVAHNGNMVNADLIRGELEESGAIFQSTMDTEVVVHLLVRENAGTFKERLANALAKIQGAYSLLVLTEDLMVAARDPFGFRPLVLGILEGAHVVASESCAFDLIGATYLREIEPGEILIISGKGTESFKPSFLNSERKGHCIFELVYFSRPDSLVFGRSVWESRKAMGRKLAEEHPTPSADIVIPVPDSGVPAAIGYSEESGIAYDLGMVRSHYVGRTFIEPSQSIRNFGVKLKLAPIRAAISRKKIVVVDDSLVRGTTSRKIVSLLRSMGAAEVHLRICSPPTTSPCFFGVDTPDRIELIAADSNIEEICRYVRADSLLYLSTEGLHQAVKCDDCSFCDGCFTGKYPIPDAHALKTRKIRLFGS